MNYDYMTHRNGLIFLGVVVVSIALTRIAHHIFYYKYESKRQIELAKLGKDSDTSGEEGAKE